MKDFGRQRSTVKPDEMVIDEFSVWIHSDIQEVSEPGIDDQEGFTGYEFNMVQYTKDEFIERKQMYTKNIDDLKTKIAEAKKNAPAPVDYSEQITTLHAIINCIKNEDVDAKTKNVFLKRFIEKITYDTIDNGVNKKVPVLEVYMK